MPYFITSTLVRLRITQRRCVNPIDCPHVAYANLGLQGLEDLKAGIIRTPLAPRETFMDDPLRVLRCVRFASRFEYTLQDEVQHAMVQNDIKVKSEICLWPTESTERVAGGFGRENQPRTCRDRSGKNAER